MPKQDDYLALKEYKFPLFNPGGAEYTLSEASVRQAYSVNFTHRKDEYGVDCMESRPGIIVPKSTISTPNIDASSPTTSVVPRGYYVWQAGTTTYHVAVIGKDIYTSTGGPYDASGWTQATNKFTDDYGGGPIGFVEGIEDDGTKYLFISGSKESYTLSTAGTLTKITDSDFPATTIPTPVFLDGYIFIPQEGTNRIFNCAPGDPTSWQASTFIQTEQFSGHLVAIARQGQYVVALLDKGIEYFADAGIASPNSPLLRVQEKALRLGCKLRSTVVSHNNDLIFLGIDTAGDTHIVKLDVEGKVSGLDNGSMYEYLRGLDSGTSSNIVGAVPSGSWGATTGASPLTGYPTWAQAGIFNFGGQVYYSLWSNVTVVNAQALMVCNLNTRHWSEWYDGGTSYYSMPIYWATGFDSSGSHTYGLPFGYYYNSGTGYKRGAALVRELVSSAVDENVGTGDAAVDVVTITSRLKFSNWSLDTPFYKFMTKIAPHITLEGDYSKQVTTLTTTIDYWKEQSTAADSMTTGDLTRTVTSSISGSGEPFHLTTYRWGRMRSGAWSFAFTPTGTSTALGRLRLYNIFAHYYNTTA